MASKLSSTGRVNGVSSPWPGCSWTAGLLWVLSTKTSKLPSTWHVRHGHEPVARLLLDCGANVGAVDENKQTPLHWACKWGH